MNRTRLRWLVSSAAVLAASAFGATQAAMAQTGAPAQPAAKAASAQPANLGAYRGWPQHVYAPYFESWLEGTGAASIAGSAQAARSPYETLAFLQTASAGSCALTWNGDSTEPVPGSTFASDIAPCCGTAATRSPASAATARTRPGPRSPTPAPT